MTAEAHAAAMALFRLLGTGARFEATKRGFQLLTDRSPAELVDAAVPHTEQIVALLKLQMEEADGTAGMRRWIPWRR